MAFLKAFVYEAESRSMAIFYVEFVKSRLSLTVTIRDSGTCYMMSYALGSVFDRQDTECSIMQNDPEEGTALLSTL